MPDGMSVDLAINKRTGKLVYQISYTEEYMTRTMLSILDERIARAEIALKICKHTKRKHQLTKLYVRLIEIRNEQQNKLNDLVINHVTAYGDSQEVL
ncbi:hypothetical protein SAMN05421832_11642 [Psychrobacillus psychrodurans]|nr:hypothetical protein SAMN05421832_11642 [Psychrobacillus psychrodurans]